MFKHLEGYEKLELSTQVLIEEAINRNYKVEVLDESSNFISISDSNKTEYIKQATKTSLDNYVSVLMMENKYVTNTILNRNVIRVPKGIKINDTYEIDNIYKEFKGKKMVVKPTSTNFGIGITILEKDYTIDMLKDAIKTALIHDSNIIIEEFIQGEEYRILVIGGEVIGILKRVPANVVGDGVSTISELVNIKNQNPLRGTNYNKPLQKISLTDVEKLVLAEQGYDFSSVLEKDQLVYLRKNSNISNGGDSIDLTDKVHYSYKEEAINATKALNVEICGVDMIIQNIEEPKSFDNYGIIELNFNPAIHIHKYPMIGESRNAAKKILNMLFNN